MFIICGQSVLFRAQAKLLLLLLYLFVGTVAARSVAAQERVFSTGYTANLTPRGRIDASFLHAFRWGIGSRLELSTQPILATLIPNVELKVSWDSLSSGQLATRHAIHYPSLFLEAVSREGTGGILPEHSIIPFILAFRHEVLFTVRRNGFRNLTAKVGVRFAIRSGESNLPTIDLPVIFHRTAAYHGRLVINAGGAFNGSLHDRLSYVLDGSLLIIPNHDGRFATELTALFGWHISKRFVLAAGYRLIAGEYPFGLEATSIPFIDFQWVVRK